MERQADGQPEEQEKTAGNASGQTAFEGVSETANGKGAGQESDATGGVEDAEHDDQAAQDTPDELTLVRAQLLAQEALAKEKDDLLLRERAELENFKRRMQREKSESLRFCQRAAAARYLARYRQSGAGRCARQGERRQSGPG